jgi:hypothetical protein
MINYVRAYLYTITDNKITVNKIKDYQNIRFTDMHTDNGIIAVARGEYAVVKLNSEFETVIIKQRKYRELEYVFYTIYGLLRVYHLNNKIRLKLGESTMELNAYISQRFPALKLVGDDHICIHNGGYTYKLYSIAGGCFDINNEELLSVPMYIGYVEVLHYGSKTDIICETTTHDIISIDMTSDKDHKSFSEVAKDGVQFVAARDGKVYVH